jgi:hypothetical protein
MIIIIPTEAPPQATHSSTNCHYQYNTQLCHGSVARPPLLVVEGQRSGVAHRGLDEDTGVCGIVVITAEVAATAAPLSSRPRQQGHGSMAMTEQSSLGHYHHSTTSPAPSDLETMMVQLSRNSAGGGSRWGNCGRRHRRAGACQRPNSTRRHGRSSEPMG